jgi:CBS domain-containing protein
MMKATEIAVKQIMSREVVIASPDDTLDDLQSLFDAYNIHHIPVVRESGELAGIISKGDLEKVKVAVDLYFRPEDEKVKARSIMTSRVATIGPDAPIDRAAGVFMANVFHALPVVEDGTLVGIITTYDLLQYCFTEEKKIEREPTP